MQFLKILFWCLLAFVAALFTYGNWESVQLHLWAGMVAEVNLPLLLLVTFLIGFLPVYLFHHTVRWRLRSRLSSAERAVTELRAIPPETPAPEPAAPIGPASDIPPAAPGTLL
jgi:lipopolysaccharide assembly protein A